MTALPIAFRPAGPEDEAFIYSSWLRSYHESETVRRIPRAVYMSEAGHQGIVKMLLAAFGATVAHPEGTPETIVGWACGDTCTLHYVYVKQPFRRLGVGRALLANLPGPQPAPAPLYVTHLTDAFRAMKVPHLFNPYLLERR